MSESEDTRSEARQTWDAAYYDRDYDAVVEFDIDASGAVREHPVGEPNDTVEEFASTDELRDAATRLLELPDEAVADPYKYYREEYDGVYYDASAADFVTFHVTSDGTVEERYEETGVVAHTFADLVAFGYEVNDFYRVPDEVIDDPVSMAEEAFEAGMDELLVSSHPTATAAQYAETKVEIVESEAESE